jgi:hypothetical protein
MGSFSLLRFAHCEAVAGSKKPWFLSSEKKNAAPGPHLILLVFSSDFFSPVQGKILYSSVGTPPSPAGSGSPLGDSAGASCRAWRQRLMLCAVEAPSRCIFLADADIVRHSR